MDIIHALLFLFKKNLFSYSNPPVEHPYFTIPNSTFLIRNSTFLIRNSQSHFFSNFGKSFLYCSTSHLIFQLLT